MKQYVALAVLSCLLFGYDDCCDSISNNFDPKEIKSEYKNPDENFDYKVFGDNFVNFSASKTEHYSNTVPIAPKESETLIEFVEDERTSSW